MGEVSNRQEVHEAIVDFLKRECGISSTHFDDLVGRLRRWGTEHSNTHGIAVNKFNPMMLLEQCRKEFDESVTLIEFSMAVAEMEMGPRLIKLPSFDTPVWVVAFQGFPAAIKAAQEFVEAREATLAK